MEQMQRTAAWKEKFQEEKRKRNKNTEMTRKIEEKGTENRRREKGNKKQRKRMWRKIKECEIENTIFQKWLEEGWTYSVCEEEQGWRDHACEKAWQDGRGKDVWRHTDNFIEYGRWQSIRYSPFR
jgi:hypothetical protein